MKNNLLNSIRKKIIVYTLVSCVITVAVELFLIIDLKMMVDFLRNSGYRSYAVGREGLNVEIQTAILILSGIAVFSVSFLIMAGDIIQYIVSIADSVEEISEGNLNTLIEVRGNDELSRLAGSVNKMTEEILVIMERERETERSKNDLITSVAHDLRTPLTSITGYLELLKSKPDLETEIREKYIEIVYNKSKRLENLIYDLFDFTKLNHGKIAMKSGSINIVQLLEQLLDEFYPSFQEHDLVYEYEASDKDIIIEADGDLIARLFDNLINNAIKYGADGKLVRVCVEDGQDAVKIAVINYGKVIPKNELKNVFKKFYRVEQSRAEGTGGTGLGLAIARNVVEMHHGHIEVTSSLKGTAFSVWLPHSQKGHKEKFSTEN